VDFVETGCQYLQHQKTQKNKSENAEVIEFTNLILTRSDLVAGEFAPEPMIP
jgi:hypothetical protein